MSTVSSKICKKGYSCKSGCISLNFNCNEDFPPEVGAVMDKVLGPVLGKNLEGQDGQSSEESTKRAQTMDKKINNTLEDISSDIATGNTKKALSRFEDLIDQVENDKTLSEDDVKRLTRRLSTTRDTLKTVVQHPALANNNILDGSTPEEKALMALDLLGS